MSSPAAQPLIAPWAESKRAAVVLKPRDQARVWALVGGLTLLLFVAYLNNVSRVADTWDSPQYSHGYLIPLFAGILLWWRRQGFTAVSLRERWQGVALIGFGLAVRLLSAYFNTFTVEAMSLLICLLGVFVLAGGWQCLRWAGPPIAFLVFMFPWPDVLVDGLLRPLKTIATQISLYALQTLGIEAFTEGNIIRLGDGSAMNVVDACSGLRMLTIFMALCVAIAMIARNRSWWERIVMVLSAIPIALAVNASRITISGILQWCGFPASFVHFFHDYAAGWFMMPLALALLYVECLIMSRLLIEVDANEPLRTNLGRAGDTS